MSSSLIFYSDGFASAASGIEIGYSELCYYTGTISSAKLLVGGSDVTYFSSVISVGSTTCSTFGLIVKVGAMSILAIRG